MELNARSEEEACKPCDETGGSNQPHMVYPDRWSGPKEAWDPAAISLQKWVKSALARQEQTDLRRSPCPPLPCSPPSFKLVLSTMHARLHVYTPLVYNCCKSVCK
jgi:hypothetical protein